jgi:hypothetical protein
LARTLKILNFNNITNSMKKQIILSILFSASATVAAFSQKAQQPNVSAAPATKEVAKDTDKTTGLERADQKTAEKPGKDNEALKAATKRKMDNKKETEKPTGAATGKNERREAAQKELRELESKKKAANRPPSTSPSTSSKVAKSEKLNDGLAPKKGAPANDGDSVQPKKKDN